MLDHRLRRAAGEQGKAGGGQARQPGGAQELLALRANPDKCTGVGRFAAVIYRWCRARTPFGRGWLWLGLLIHPKSPLRPSAYRGVAHYKVFCPERRTPSELVLLDYWRFTT